MTTPRRLLALGAASAAAAGAAVLFRFDPMRVGFYPRCPLFVITGVFCPGCGALRAGHALLHGRLLEALDFNVVFVAALPFLLYALASRAWAAAGGRPFPAPFLPRRAIWGVFAVLAAFGALRNLPFAPFAVLAP